MVMDIDNISKKFSAHSFFLTIQRIRIGRGVRLEGSDMGGSRGQFFKNISKNFSAHSVFLTIQAIRIVRGG